MKKTTYEITLNYEYQADRKGAKYLIDGIKWANCGELIESIMKHHRNLPYLKNPTTKWNEGSDIESEQASVKSGKASVATIYGDSIEAILEIYMANVASQKFIYGIIIDNEMNEYEMDLCEFVDFVRVFGRLVKEAGHDRTKIQLLQTSGKTIKYLEERVGA